MKLEHCGDAGPHDGHCWHPPRELGAAVTRTVRCIGVVDVSWTRTFVVPIGEHDLLVYNEGRLITGPDRRSR